MTPLRNLPVAVIDFEATSLPSADAHVIEVAVVLHELGSEAEPRIAVATRVRPPVPITNSQYHGITDADVADAPTWAEIAPRVREALAGRVVVAFNAPADFTYLRAEESRLGVVPSAPWPWMDLLVVRKATKTRGRPGRLGEILAEYGIDLDPHGATGDALGTALLLTPMMRRAWAAGAFRGPEGAGSRPWRDDWEEDDKHEDEAAPVVDTLETFLAWQRYAALYQERDFAAWARGKGWATPPDSPWHALEGAEAPTWGRPTTSAGPCPECGAAVRIRIEQDGTRSRIGLTSSEPHACRS